MHAYVRFRERSEAEGAPRFVAWYEPVHEVLPQVARHFARRMGSISWMIATPAASMLWDGQTLHAGPALLRGVAVPTPALGVSLTPGGTLEVASGPETLGRPGSRARLIGPDGLPYFVNIFSSEGWLPLGQPLRRFENVAAGTYTLAVDGGASRAVEVREGLTTRAELP